MRSTWPTWPSATTCGRISPRPSAGCCSTAIATRRRWSAAARRGGRWPCRRAIRWRRSIRAVAAWPDRSAMRLSITPSRCKWPSGVCCRQCGRPARRRLSPPPGSVAGSRSRRGAGGWRCTRRRCWRRRWLINYKQLNEHIPTMDESIGWYTKPR
ncbi:protein of unknown function [Candidatus Promineifilum breve]|uniref:Uncharacterized protein n=1 Tax=Candidatus Promineifilum breve TaxID=1806508 RepID=A0A160T8T6_9CHLR|nr:protein of unknown function [Candidatus Promineifilum breve]